MGALIWFLQQATPIPSSTVNDLGIVDKILGIFASGVTISTLFFANPILSALGLAATGLGLVALFFWVKAKLIAAEENAANADTQNTNNSVVVNDNPVNNQDNTDDNNNRNNMK